ncbi:hypothetical protein ATI61_106650 [Archangium gephyra]|uniref:DUF3089 domain-containing protein n=1 Tax=Archangium gephyra TaxID=48 RepID=A0AAC8Q1R1_9BACT|nr:DUF3089 domain-containing protein [Archangium gephyra]AKI99275.1 Hypothetical protein AA314_00902 [Archangium gephyra]REG31180.1 hypothetical protein ATI61_106650 [Archangium gephyra]
MRNKLQRLLSATLLVCTLLLVLLGMNFASIFLWSVTPRTPFSEARAPTPPDYSRPSTWSALPELHDLADTVPPSSPALEQSQAPVDVFYIHPTTYIGGEWNGPVDDATLNEATDRVATLIQASAFNACCAIYAPRYRQANMTAFTGPVEKGQAALDLAYRDVAAAFRYWREHFNRGRPFILAAHSQGTVLARRLLHETVSGTPLRHQLVAAYLIGIPMPEDTLQRSLPDIPFCDSPEQTGCLISWNARTANATERIQVREPVLDAAPSPGPFLCVNPLTWRHDTEPASWEQNPGAVFLEATPPQVMPGLTGAQCKKGKLEVLIRGDMPRDFMSRLLDHAMGEGNHHPVEFQLFYMSIRRNAAERVAAFLRSNATPNTRDP